MKPPICAIYTRKSSEEGLEQSFNSLDAQREACEAYIKSQHHEGWRVIATHYDDGGYSGGNIDRPALKQLIADIHKPPPSCSPRFVTRRPRLRPRASSFASWRRLPKPHKAGTSALPQTARNS